MKKISKILLSIMIGFFGLALIFGLSHNSTPSQNNERTPANAFLSKTNSTSNIFKEITNDGLASYLEISLNGVNGITDLKITQTIGAVSYTLTTDELGENCYYDNTPLTDGNTRVFYFTRPASYNVQYKINNGAIVSETCTFYPQINIGEVEKIYTYDTDGNGKEINIQQIKEIDNKFYILNSGNLKLVSPKADSLHSQLYTISDNGFLNLVPENTFGNITYTITSNNGHTSLSQAITIVTTNFDVSFKNKSGHGLVNEEHTYLDNFVFNEGVSLTIKVSASAKGVDGNTLNAQQKQQLFETLDFSIIETVRNENNSGDKLIKQPINLNIQNKSGSDPYISYTLNNVDHSIFSIKTNIKDSTTTYNNNIPKIKIITKVPQKDANDYIFKISLEQVTNHNYLQGVLNGYIPTGTIINFATYGITISHSSDNLYYSVKKSGQEPSEFKSLSVTGLNFNANNSTITLKNKPSSFDQFFIFSVSIKTYAENCSFGTTMLNDKISLYTGTSSAEKLKDDFKDSIYTYTIDKPLSKLTYTTPDNYNTTCIPMFIRVTHNGTTFDNIHTLTNNDVLSFTSYGNYTIEFYVIPNYEFLVSLIDKGFAISNHYYKLSFTIAGPSIKASTTDNKGNTLTVSNHMYTQNDVNFDISLGENQTAIIYKNGNEVARNTENWTNSITKNFSGSGTWKIVIIDSNNTELSSLSFTLLDSLYQGLTINEHPEYDSLTVSTLVSSMPVVYEAMENQSAYHLTQAGKYKIDMQVKEQFFFMVSNGGNLITKSAHTLNTNSIMVEIAKSYFSLNFTEGSNGSRISSDISISSVSGVQLQTLEVFINGKLEKTYTADQLADWEGMAVLEKFSANGTYTFKLTDVFGNTYESQIEKYYKVNVALILLIILAIVALIIMIIVIIKARHRISVK